MNHIFFHTPMGIAAIVYEANPFCLMKTLLPAPNSQALMPRIPAPSIEDDSPSTAVLQIRDEILNYFKSRAVRIPFEDLSLGRLTPLQQAVLKAVYEIPFGRTRSYGDIAAEIGKPKAARFVGTTMANNPFPILIPCHRVIKSDGSPGMFGGGTDLKVRLIRHEKKK